MNSKTLFSLIAVAILSFVATTTVLAQSITDPEETQIVLENAEVTFMTCDPNDFNTTGDFSEVKYYDELECDHNILFLKGQCEDSNNTAYNWCYNADMERYLNDRGLKDAPRPPDVWCNMLIDACIAKYESFKESVIESGEPLGLSDSPATNKLVDSLDDMIHELENKKDAAVQGEDTNNDDSDDEQ